MLPPPPPPPPNLPLSPRHLAPPPPPPPSSSMISTPSSPTFTRRPQMLSLGLPNNTLYIQNLNERISLKKMKLFLQVLMSKYGNVIDIMLRGSLSMRGQAFVVFEDLPSAISAIEAFQGVMLHGKRVVIKFANSKSHIISRKDGTFEIEERRRMVALQSKQHSSNRMSRRIQIRNILLGNPVNMILGSGGSGGGDGLAARTNIAMSTSHRQGNLQSIQNIEDPLINKIIFIEDIPDSFGGRRALEVVFETYTGFIEVRTIPNRPKLAFVEYESEQKAAMALRGLKEDLEKTGLKLSFAKK